MTKNRDDTHPPDVRDDAPTGVALARYAPRMGGLVPCPAALAGIFSKEVKKKIALLTINVTILVA